MQAWLMLAAGDDRQHAGNEGYDDDPSSHYSWDETVHNRNGPKRGDGIILWDKKTLIGASVIESVTRGRGSKEILRCPACKQAKIKDRKHKKPTYRCYRKACLAEFREPERTRIKVETYRSNHSSAWLELSGYLDAKQLRLSCINPSSIHSIREINWPLFLEKLGGTGLALDRICSDASTRILGGGRRLATVRVRQGQGKFRRKLLERFGPTCAFSGPLPESALDAAHLYSYANEEVHHDHGGILLRKDLHRLFDLGQIRIDPDRSLIVTSSELEDFPSYSALNGQSVQVQLSPRMRKWIRQHYDQHERNQ